MKMCNKNSLSTIFRFALQQQEEMTVPPKSLRLWTGWLIKDHQMEA